MEQTLREYSNSRNSRSSSIDMKIVDEVWTTIIEPILAKIVKKSGKSIIDGMAELVDRGITLGYIVKTSGGLNYLKKFGILSMFQGYAVKSTEEDVRNFIRWVLEEVLPRKMPGVSTYIKNNPEAYQWFEQSIFELWRILRGEL